MENFIVGNEYLYEVIERFEQDSIKNEGWHLEEKQWGRGSVNQQQLILCNKNHTIIFLYTIVRNGIMYWTCIYNN